MRLLLLLVACTGCYTVVYEPTVCRREGMDTVGVVTVDGVTTAVITRTRCAVWQAFSDSTKCWNADGDRLGSCP